MGLAYDVYAYHPGHATQAVYVVHTRPIPTANTQVTNKRQRAHEFRKLKSIAARRFRLGLLLVLLGH